MPRKLGVPIPRCYWLTWEETHPQIRSAHGVNYSPRRPSPPCSEGFKHYPGWQPADLTKSTSVIDAGKWWKRPAPRCPRLPSDLPIPLPPAPSPLSFLLGFVSFLLSFPGFRYKEKRKKERKITRIANLCWELACQTLAERCVYTVSSNINIPTLMTGLRLRKFNFLQVTQPPVVETL